MTIQDILKLPTSDIEKLSDKELQTLLGDLIPQSRRPDKEAADKRDLNQLLKQAQILLKK